MWHTTTIPLHTAHVTTVPSSTITYAPINLPITITEQTVDGKRYYLYDGEYYPSITTLLDATDHDGRKALQEWQKNIGIDAASAITRAAANRGTRWHQFCEDFIMGQFHWSSLADPGDLQYAATIADVLNDRVDTVMASESRIVSTDYGVAGRMDVGAKLKTGRCAIIDFKTGRKEKTGTRLQNYALQTTFYADALTEWTGQPVDQIVIVQLLPDKILWQESEASLWRETLRQRVHDYAMLLVELNQTVDADPLGT